MALLALGGGILWIGLAAQSYFSRTRNFRTLVATNDHAALLRDAVQAIKTLDSTEVFGGSPSNRSLTNLPATVMGLHPKYVSVEPDRMRIEFHGGMDHFGFEIRRITQDWQLFSYTEHNREVLATMKEKDETTGEPVAPPNRSQSRGR